MALVATAVAADDSVWVSAGGADGQGQILVLRGQCYAVTAAHVVAREREGVSVISLDGYRATARVLARMDELDLALLQVDEARGTSSRVCNRRRVPAVLPTASLPAQVTRASGIWIDRVSSPAGGLERIELALTAIEPGGRQLRLEAASVPSLGIEGRLPRAGDSGAAIWLAPRSNPRSRYAADGQPLRQVLDSRVLLGLYTGGGDREAVAVPAERVRDFVLQALVPVATGGLQVEPAGARLVTLLRGRFPRKTDTTLEIDDSAVETVSLEFDLGDEDTVVTGIAVQGSAALPSPPGPPALRVTSSMFRPGPEARWTDERCDRRQPPSRGVVTAWRSECALATPRVTRGIRVEVTGRVAGLSGVTLLVAR